MLLRSLGSTSASTAVRNLRFARVQHTLMRASVLFPYLMLLHALYRAQDLGLLFLSVFHVDMMGRNCFLALLSILITGFQEFLDLKD